MEMLFGDHHAGLCSRQPAVPDTMSWQARPSCAVLAQALRDQARRSARLGMLADV